MSRVGRIALPVAILSAMLAFAQNPQNAKDGSTAGSPQNASPGLRVDIDLVLLNATVTDPQNRYVTGLKMKHFQVWEDKVEQQIEYFSSEDVPTSVGIIFDISGSMSDKLAPARAAAATFMKMGNRDDEYLLIEFSDSPRLVQGFTTDITRLQTQLLFTRAKGMTSLYDALYLGMEKVNHGNNFRKAVLLITDGEDNHSRYSFSEVRDFAREHDVQIYAIGIVDQSTLRTSAAFSGQAVLENLAGITGGRAFFPGSAYELEDICAQIGADLKNQYVLGYRSSNSSADGKWRKVRVKINRPKGMPALSVRAKAGYYAPMFARATN